MYTKDDFNDHLKAWYETVKENVSYYKDADFKFIVTRDNYSFCFDGKHGNRFLESKWVLEHVDVVDGAGFWRQFFNTEEEVYDWGCAYLKEMIRKYRSLDPEPQVEKSEQD